MKEPLSANAYFQKIGSVVYVFDQVGEILQRICLNKHEPHHERKIIPVYHFLERISIQNEFHRGKENFLYWDDRNGPFFRCLLGYHQAPEELRIYAEFVPVRQLAKSLIQLLKNWPAPRLLAPHEQLRGANKKRFKDES